MELRESLSSTRPIGFFDLPLELRHQIYQYCHVLKEAVKALNKYHYHSCDWGMRDRKEESSTCIEESRSWGHGNSL